MVAPTSPAPKPKKVKIPYSELIDPINPPDGHWITDPPYNLPSGIEHCPMPSCKAYHRTFRPYWRLNEHMKLRHGWPRKTTQPLLDKRLGNRFGQNKKRRLSESQLSDATDATDDADSVLSPLPTPSDTGSKVGSTSVAEDLAVNHDMSVDAMSVDAMSVDATSVNASSEDGMSVDGDTATSYEPKGTNDPLMEAEVRHYIDEFNLDVRGGASPDLVEGRKKMVAGLHDLLNHSLIQVNTILPSHQSRNISAYYLALSTRASFSCSGPKAASMRLPPAVLPSPPLPVPFPLRPRATPVSRIILHNQRRSTSSTPLEADQGVPIESASKLKLKLVLKMTPTQPSPA